MRLQIFRLISWSKMLMHLEKTKKNWADEAYAQFLQDEELGIHPNAAPGQAEAAVESLARRKK